MAQQTYSSSLGQTVGQTVDEKIDNLTQASRQKLEDIKQKRIGDVYNDTKGWVQDNPLKMMAGLTAAGIVLGWLLGRKR